MVYQGILGGGVWWIGNATAPAAPVITDADQGDETPTAALPLSGADMLVIDSAGYRPAANPFYKGKDWLA